MYIVYIAWLSLHQRQFSLFCFLPWKLYLRFFEPPNLSEVISSIQSLRTNKAVEHDNIPAFFLKAATLTIAPYLITLIDYAFSNGIFPDSCKTAKVIPLHKSGNTDNPNNFRPVSILSCFAKIFEKILYKRLTQYFEKII